MNSQTGPISSSSQTAIDIEDFRRLDPYLRSKGLLGAAEQASYRVLAGGVSSRTVLAEPAARPAFVLKQSLAKLRVAADWFSPPDRIHREALGMRWLEKLAPPGAITSLLFEDFSAHVIAMSAVPQPHRNWKEMLLSEPPLPGDFAQFALILGQVHAKSYCDGSLQEIFGDRSLFESLRLEPYYRYSTERVPQAAAFLERLIEDTLRQRLSLVHGDFSPKNILVHEGKFVLVDHEVIHFGDPAFDVGFSLCHFLAKALHRSQSREGLLEGAEGYVRRYLACVRPRFGAAFDPFESRACRHTAACLLARVDGRSPLEYLAEQEREWQRTTALKLMATPPPRLIELIERFEEELTCLKSNN